MKHFVITMLVAIVSSAQGVDLEFMEEFTSAQELYDARQLLGYGDACSWKDEAFRIQTQRTLLHLASTITTIETFSIMAHEQNKLTIQTFCNEELNLQCKEGSETCGCDDLTRRVHDGVNFTTNYEDGQCRSPLGSTCLSFETDDTTNEALCTSGTKCKIKSSGLTCTQDNFSAELIKQGIIPTTGRSATSIYSASTVALSHGFCQCL